MKIIFNFTVVAIVDIIIITSFYTKNTNLKTNDNNIL